MTSPRKPGFLLPVAVTLAVLLGLYVGAYYAIVEVLPEWSYVPGTPGEPWYSASWIPPGYRQVVDRCLTPAFAPIHALDRRLRPHIWDAKP